MSTYRSRVADQRVADDAIADRSLLCSASGCPNRWSLNFGKPLCRAHAFAEPHQWPQVTQEQLDAETDRALAAAAPKLQATVTHWSMADKRALLKRLREVFATPVDPRAWARNLRDRERSGARLTQAQRTAWRAVLQAAPTFPTESGFSDDEIAHRERIAEQQRRIDEYAIQRGIAL